MPAVESMHTIFFDIDDTLVDYKAAERAAALVFYQDHMDHDHETPDAFIVRWQTVTEKHFQRYLSGELSFQGQRRTRLREIFAADRALADADADHLFAGYLRRYEQNWRLHADVEECLRALDGFSLGIISNGDSTQQRQKLTALAINGRFDHVVISGDIGVVKPDAKIFHAACALAGRDPAECLYVGDHPEVDARGAARAGLASIWLNRHGTAEVAGLTSIRSLLDLVPAIQALCR